MTSPLANISIIQHRKVTFFPSRNSLAFTFFQLIIISFHSPLPLELCITHHSMFPNPPRVAGVGLPSPSSSMMQSCPLHSSAPPEATHEGLQQWHG